MALPPDPQYRLATDFRTVVALCNGPSAQNMLFCHDMIIIQRNSIKDKDQGDYDGIASACNEIQAIANNDETTQCSLKVDQTCAKIISINVNK